MSKHTITGGIASARREALDTGAVTLPNLMRVVRTHRAMYRSWEQGEECSPDTRDLQFGTNTVTDSYTPHDAQDLVEQEMYDAQCAGATLAEVALISLMWVVVRKG